MPNFHVKSSFCNYPDSGFPKMGVPLHHQFEWNLPWKIHPPATGDHTFIAIFDEPHLQLFEDKSQFSSHELHHHDLLRVRRAGGLWLSLVFSMFFSWKSPQVHKYHAAHGHGHSGLCRFFGTHWSHWSWWRVGGEDLHQVSSLWDSNGTIVGPPLGRPGMSTHRKLNQQTSGVGHPKWMSLFKNIGTC